MTTPTIVFVDIESTGLDPERHHMWELAAVHLDGRIVYGRWQVDLTGAEPRALAMGRYYERAVGMPHAGDTRDERAIAWDLATLTVDAHITGAAPHFDAGFVSRWLQSRGAAAAWVHRIMDVCTYASGAWGLPVPRSLRETLADAEIEHDSRAHTAMYDALQARLLWTRVAEEGGVIADWPAHELVVERAGQHVKAWEHGLPMGPEPIDLPHADSLPCLNCGHHHPIEAGLAREGWCQVCDDCPSEEWAPLGGAG